MKHKIKNKKIFLALVGMLSIVLTGCSPDGTTIEIDTADIDIQGWISARFDEWLSNIELPTISTDEITVVEDSSSNDNIMLDNNMSLISVEPCDISGNRQANVKVDIGMDTNFANREYYAYTNKYGQLVKVEAADIIVQNDKKEAEESKGDGRYCSDEAKVSGVESKTLDEGHAIADSLGGVSNAYNITPQDSNLNRKGAQYQMEDKIRNYEYEGKDVTNFIYNIKYEDNNTSIPSLYYGSYEVDGKVVKFSFNNE